jgi:hypothetical protein
MHNQVYTQTKGEVMRDFLVTVVAVIGVFLALLVAFPALLIAMYCVAVPCLAAVIVLANALPGGNWIVLAMMAVVSLGLCVLK